MPEVLLLPDEAATRALGADMARRLRPGDVVRLDGPLGAGKTTLVRGLVAALGHPDEVRSPTFGLLNVYGTEPPIAHADLYRVADWRGIGLEDLLDTHVLLIEWPDRADGLLDPKLCWRIDLAFGHDGAGRQATIHRPLE